MSAEKPLALRCSNLHRYLGQGEGRVHVLRGVSFEARGGDVYAIVGPSGCGKSTLLYLLGLLDQPDGGEIEIAGRRMSNTDDAVRTAARGEHIGFVFQFHFLMLEFSALENVMMPMRKLGQLTPPQMEERARSLLSSVGLGEKTHRLGTQLSGGEQQRVAVARALANNPRILLADEPTGNLDPRTSGGVFDALVNLVRSEGLAALIATHNFELAAKMDRALVLHEGRLVDGGKLGASS